MHEGLKSLEDGETRDNRMTGALGLGKVSREVLRRSVFPFLPLEEEPTLDGGMIHLGDRTVVAHSPSIGVPIAALGFFAFHYAASNVASLFAKPVHMVVGFYLPLKTREEDLRVIAKGLGGEAKRYDVTIAAGQTAAYYGLEIPLVTATCLGKPVRRPEGPHEGDCVVVVGAIGGEALWLRDLSEGCTDDRWKSFTPLPAALSLQECEGVKLMHDVSEGGVKGALWEIAEAMGVRLEINSERMFYAEGVKEIVQDALRAPTYGVLIAVVDSKAVEEVTKICDEAGYTCAVVGEVRAGEGAYVDCVKVEGLERTSLDELYGTFSPEKGFSR